MGMHIYVSVKKWLFISTGMGYNEDQYSLPRWQDLSISRQGMYDDTFIRIPTQGWMFVPLLVYHGGGAPAIFEPLKDHLVEYRWALAQYLGAGVAACYRGNRLYDTDDTKSLVKEMVSFYKQYRAILTSDIIHVRRADMQSIDSYMHVNPFLVDKGLAMVFNPTAVEINTSLRLPLYYTGLTHVASVFEQRGPVSHYTLERDYSIHVPISVKPLGITWFLIR